MFNIGAKFGDGWSIDEVCSKCGLNKSECICNNIEILEPKEHRLKLKNEKRNGKIVTLIGDFFLTKDSINSLLKELKKSLATGGGVEDKNILLQGDAKRAREILEKKGFKFK